MNVCQVIVMTMVYCVLWQLLITEYEKAYDDFF